MNPWGHNTITLDGVFCDGKWYDTQIDVKNEEKKV